MALEGERSLFQNTVDRVFPLVSEHARLIVIAGIKHRDAVVAQLRESGIDAEILLEPESRNSAAAMTAAAEWTRRQDPEAINIFVASDHHIPDSVGFRRAVEVALDGAAAGRIVTLGVTPSRPSAAYGYIEPAASGLSAVTTFVEKPDKVAATEYIKNGYLWNSGNFVVRSAVILDELARHAPSVSAAAVRAVDESTRVGDVTELGASFRDAPKVSIDYAVMEATDLASVLPVDFDWSDLGTWQSLHDAGNGSIGQHLLENSENCLIRACEGVIVAAVGVRDLAIVVEPDAVLVTDLASSQGVAKVVERVGAVFPTHLDRPQSAPPSLAASTKRISEWLRLRALPMWACYGQDGVGCFVEALTLDGRPVIANHRARVQARQVQVFSAAAARAGNGQWVSEVSRGLDYLLRRYLREDGLMRTLLDARGESLDDTPMLYDQAFYLFALAATERINAGSCVARAVRARDILVARNDKTEGFVEFSSQPFQSNAHMHLLEASLAWEAADAGDEGWRLLSDRIALLAVSHFIDKKSGALREFFNSSWRPADGEDGRLIEPGHQFEWAWLLTRYGRARSNQRFINIAEDLYRWGLKGLDNRRQVIIDALNDDGSVRSARARLWPQTEWLKAALILSETTVEDDRRNYANDASRAISAVESYLTADGLWRDRLLEDGSFIDEPAPATSFYHIFAAWEQLAITCSSQEHVNDGSCRLA